MASRQTQAVSRPLLIIFLIVVVIGVVMFAMNQSAGTTEDVKVPIPEVPTDLKPAPEDPLGRGPTTGG